MVVAYVEVETPQARQFRMAATGIEDPFEKSAVLPRRGSDGEDHATYWCAADKPNADGETFAIRPIYRTNDVPEDAECVECHIGIRELQAMFSEAPQ